jgi:hypothetical protein
MTWAVFFLTTIATGIIYWFVERKYKDAKYIEEADWEERDEDKKDMWHGIYFTFMQCQTSASLEPRTFQGRIVSVSWAAFSIVFAAAYTANLASCLMELKDAGGWKNIGDAMNAGATICVDHDRGYRYMDQKYPDYMDKVIRLNYGAGPIKELVKGRCDTALAWHINYDAARVKKKFNPDCKLHKVGGILQSSRGGWSLLQDSTDKCTILIQQVFRTLYMEMFEVGETNELYDKQLVEVGQTTKTQCGALVGTQEDEQVSMPLISMAGLFLFHLIGVCCGFLYYLCVGRTGDTESTMSMQNMMTSFSSVGNFRASTDSAESAAPAEPAS